MKKIALVALAVVVFASVMANAAMANVSYGTRNITITNVDKGVCDNTLVNPTDDPAYCDVMVAGRMTVRNSGTKLLVVTCPVNVWKIGAEGIVASTEVHLLIKPHRAQTVLWVARGDNTIPVDAQSANPKDYTALRRSSLRTQVVSCI